MPPPPPPEPVPDGTVRLVGRVDINGFATGALQLALDGAYGAVCAKGFGAADAAVACRQLGFAAGTVVRPLPIIESAQDITDLAREVLAPFVIENLGCEGDEAALLDCPAAEDAAAEGVAAEERYLSGYGEPDGCAPFRSTRTESLASSFAFVACSLGDADAEEGQLRLAEGGAAEGAAFGRLEVFLNGGWGTVCNLRDPRGFLGDAAPFTAAAVTVACRQLGFDSGARIQSQEDFDFGEPTNITRIPIAVAGADCAGTEDSLLACPRGLPERQVGAPVGPCTHNDDVYLACSSGTFSSAAHLQLRQCWAGMLVSQPRQVFLLFRFLAAL